jgi:hypothetical protein
VSAAEQRRGPLHKGAPHVSAAYTGYRYFHTCSDSIWYCKNLQWGKSILYWNRTGDAGGPDRCIQAGNDPFQAGDDHFQPGEDHFQGEFSGTRPEGVPEQAVNSLFLSPGKRGMSRPKSDYFSRV